jgi:hypothetical protein
VAEGVQDITLKDIMVKVVVEVALQQIMDIHKQQQIK